MCIYECLCVYVCVCVCERERESVCVCVCVVFSPCQPVIDLPVLDSNENGFNA